MCIRHTDLHFGNKFRGRTGYHDRQFTTPVLMDPRGSHFAGWVAILEVALHTKKSWANQILKCGQSDSLF